MSRAINLVLTKRQGDIHVCVEGRPEIWACGKTTDEAIGNLVRTHSEHVGIQVAWNRSDAWTERYLNNDPLTR